MARTVPARLQAFVGALNDAIAASGMTEAAVAHDVGISEDTLYTHRSGKTEPPPARVFAIEVAVGVPPGSLSRHLGYLPLSAANELRHTLQECIEEDPALSDRSRRLLLVTLRECYRSDREEPGSGSAQNTLHSV